MTELFDRPTEPLTVPAPLFVTGMLVGTPGALEAMKRTGTDLIQLVERHVRGDWGELDQEDRNENWHGVQHGFRILSNYPLADGTYVWLITERDRSATTLLLPKDY